MNAGKSKMKMGDGKKKLTKKWRNGEMGEWVIWNLLIN